MKNITGCYTKSKPETCSFCRIENLLIEIIDIKINQVTIFYMAPGFTVYTFFSFKVPATSLIVSMMLVDYSIAFKKASYEPNLSKF